MTVCYVTLLLLMTIGINGTAIPSIENVILRPLNENDLNDMMRFNTTCDRCLCDFFTNYSNQSFLALNCFNNHTCQFFSKFPKTYRLQPMNQSSLYFLKNIFPNASSCCMSSISDLISRLKSATPIVVNLPFQPSSMSYEEQNPSEIALIGRHGAWVYWLNASNLQFIRNNSIVNTSLTFAAYNQSIYTVVENSPLMTVYNRQSNAVITTVTHPTFSRVRKFIFTNDGRNMLFTAQDNNSIAIFDINSPTNYSFQVRAITSQLFSFLRCFAFRECFRSHCPLFMVWPSSTTPFFMLHHLVVEPLSNISMRTRTGPLEHW